MHDEKESGIRGRIEQELDSLRGHSRFRSLQIIDGLNLSSNDYLGLSTAPGLIQSLEEAVARRGPVGSTGSRLLSGNSVEWESCERDFAEFAGTESALYFGSGYAANVGLLSSLLKPGDVVFSDELNHASLIDGIRLSGARKEIYPHGDLLRLECALREHADEPGARVIVTESIFSMEGDFAPIESLLGLARKYGAELVIDEAHATGTWGPQGRGVAAELGVEREILAIVHTCGKALASAGAFVCSSGAMKDYLVNRARTFIFSTAMPPYFARQIQAALAVARDAERDRAHLREIASSLREALSNRGFNCGTSATHIVPVIFGSDDAALHVASELQVRGFAVKAIRPPTVPEGTARIRISLTSNISQAEIHRLVDAMTSINRLLPRIASASVVHA